MSKINVKNTEVTLIKHGDEDYISITDMIKAKDGDFFVSDWLRNRNTVEFLGIWEELNNPDFNYGEFATIKNQVGLNSYKISVKDWIEKTNAIGLKASAGRYGGTYAHKDIAFQFGMWISPKFQLLLIKEFQRLKDEEAQRLQSGWDYRRFLSKTNYSIHTDAIKEHIIPELTEVQAKFAYANEADMLNVAMFGLTAKQWKDKNPSLHLQGLNMRDLADVHQLIVLSNLESSNAYLISKGINQSNRLLELRKSAISQLNSLRKSSYTIEKIQSPFKTSNSTQISSGNKTLDNGIKIALKNKSKQ